MNPLAPPPELTERRTAPVAGTAHLTFARSGSRTILERSFATSPVKVFTTRNHGGACWVYCATLGGGFVGGDEVRMTLDARHGARALVTTQASTKVYRSMRPASQSISAVIDDDALLAMMPDPQLGLSRHVGPWGFACMKAFIEPSDDQLVPVQNVFRRSRSSVTAGLPSALAACRAIRSV